MIYPIQCFGWLEKAFVPSGPIENSPAFQRWVVRGDSSPVGTAEPAYIREGQTDLGG